MTKEPLVMVKVAKYESIKDRLGRISSNLSMLKSKDFCEIISDDEVMLKVAPKMIASLKNARFIKTWDSGDGYYHTLIEKV